MAPIGLVPEKVEVITMACCTLHNYLRSRVEACSVYTPPGSIDTEHPQTHELQLGQWHDEVPLIGHLQDREAIGTAKDVREKLCTYFNSKDGEVSWQ